jgi:hypothetical protein
VEPFVDFRRTSVDFRVIFSCFCHPSEEKVEIGEPESSN